MKRVFIIHGWGGNPKEPMHQWLHSQLSKNNYYVESLRMPKPDSPVINLWVGTISKFVKIPSPDTFFIGHSIGCQAILRYLETIHSKVGGAVLIAPWTNLTGLDESEKLIARQWLETPIAWPKVKQRLLKSVCLFSDNDPYVQLSNQETFKNNLGSKIIIERGKGHFTEGDAVTSNQTALTELLKMSS